LESHLRLVNEILQERGYIVNGQFNPQLRATTASMVVETFKSVEDIYLMVKERYREGASWEAIQRALLRSFGSRHQLLEELDKRMNKLKFVKPYSVFISDVKSLYHLNRRLFSEGSDRRRLVQHVLSCLPEHVGRPLIDRLMRIDSDFELAVSFDKFVEMLETSLATKEAVERVYPRSTQTHQPIVRRVFQVDPVSPLTGEKNENRFFEKYENILVCTGRDAAKVIQEALQRDPALGAKLNMRNKKGYTYHLVGYNGSQAPELSCKSRPFVRSVVNQKN
jgi:hypothetical protein